MARQLALKLPQWGGRRRGAGRKPIHPVAGLIRPGVPHLRRPEVKPRNPVHVTTRLLRGSIAAQVRCAAGSRGMQGLAVRSAKAINRALGRSGRVFADRFHARSLETRREVANALRYVLHNAHRQGETAARDPYSSERWIWRTPDETAPVRAPRTWLLRVGWLPGLERRARD